MIFAPTAVEAATEALSGTISVEFEGETVEYFFGPDSVGDVSDHKAFAVSVSGSDVVILLEDMADFPDATPDWDYNDQSWEVTVMGSLAPDIYDGEFTWTGPFGSATVTVDVTAIDPDTYKWNYHVHNDSFIYHHNGENGDGFGIGHYTVEMADGTVIEGAGSTIDADSYTVSGGETTDDAITWEWADGVEGSPGVMPGDEADFYFTTAALPVGDYEGDVTDTLDIVESGGGCAAPAEEPEVMITDKDGNPVGVNTLRVAKWENAFICNQATNWQITPKPVDAATGYDIIDLDPDHFIVWVKDNKKWTDGVPRITANVSTDNEPGFRGYNDPSSVIDLVRCTGTDSKNGWYMSDSQMLVSNRIDDTAAIQGVGSDESGLGILGPTKSGGFSWRQADRTHQIALGGTVGVTYAFNQVGGEIVELGNVIVRSSIKSHVNILNAPNGLVLCHTSNFG